MKFKLGDVISNKYLTGTVCMSALLENTEVYLIQSVKLYSRLHRDQIDDDNFEYFQMINNLKYGFIHEISSNHFDFKDFKLVDHAEWEDKKYKIGQVCANKKTNAPGVIGTICGRFPAKDIPKIDRYYNLFPDYLDKDMYVIHLTEKQPNLSINEFIEYKMQEQASLANCLYQPLHKYLRNSSYEEVKKLIMPYLLEEYKNYPKFWTVYTPEDDIHIL